MVSLAYDAADNILLNFTNLPASLTGVTISANEGADTVNLQASSNVSVSISGGDGLDTINVGNNGAIGAPGLLTPVPGPVVVDGGPGGANLVVDGSGAGVAADYTITSTAVTRSLPAGFGGVTYSNLSSLLLTVGSGANVIMLIAQRPRWLPTLQRARVMTRSSSLAGVSLNGGTVDGGADTDTLDL